MLEELNVGRFEIHSEKNYISVYRLEGGVFVWNILCNKKINSNFMKLINLFGPAGRARERFAYIVFSSTFSGGGGAETVLRSSSCPNRSCIVF
jgi:hypothetical protein